VTSRELVRRCSAGEPRLNPVLCLHCNGLSHRANRRALGVESTLVPLLPAIAREQQQQTIEG